MADLTAFDDLDRRLQEDPQGLRAEIEAELLAENGPEWVEAHKPYADADWEAALAILGYPAGGETNA